jgi:hypothetical protein
MCWQRFSIRILMVIVALAALSPTVSFAQGFGGGTADAPTVGGGTGNNGNTGTANTGSTQDGQTGSGQAGISAEEAFSGVNRAGTVGATSRTGMGFSDVGVSGGGLGGGLGGLGGGFGGFGGMGGLFGGQGLGGQAQTSKPVIRTRLRTAFEGPRPQPQIVGQRIHSQLQSVPQSAGLTGVNVSVDGNTAIISGVVATDKQRRMSELLMRLEPGVRNVENRINVVPQR